LKVPSAFLYTVYYYENFIRSGDGPANSAGLLKIGEGKYAFSKNMQDKKIAMVSIRDIGKAAAKLFSDPSYIG